MKIKYITIFLLLIGTHLFSATLVVDNFNDGSDPMSINGGSTIEAIGEVKVKYHPHNETNTALGNTGYCIEIQHTNTGGGSWVKFNFNSTVDIKQYRAFSFWIKGTNGRENFNMDLRATGAIEPNFRPNIENFLTNGITTNWQKVVIPTWALHTNSASRTTIDGFIMDLSGAFPIMTIYIDDMTFHDTLAPCYLDTFDDGTDPSAFGIMPSNLEYWDAGNPGVGYGYDAVTPYGSYGNSHEIDWSAGNFPHPSTAYIARQLQVRNWSAANPIGQNLKSCNQISFYSKAGTGGDGRRIGLGIFSSAGSEETSSTPFVLSTSWQRFSYDMTTFAMNIRTNLNGIQWYMVKTDLCTNTNNFTFYVDNIMFEDTLAPSTPSALMSDGAAVNNGYNFNKNTNTITVTAQDDSTDNSIEAVYFEFSTNGSAWHCIGTDYDVSDSTYSITWDVTSLNTNETYSIRAVARDVSGNTSALTYNNCTIEMEDPPAPPDSSYFSIENRTERDQFSYLESINIKVHIISSNALSHALLYYKESSQAQYMSQSMLYFEGLYQAELNPQNKAGKLHYYVQATDISNKTVYYPSTGSSTPLELTITGPEKDELEIYNTLIDFTKGESKAKIRFTVPSEGLIKVNIYNIHGELIKKITEANYTPGIYEKQWDVTNESGESVKSGIYLITIKTGYDKVIIKKIMVVR